MQREILKNYQRSAVDSFVSGCPFTGSGENLLQRRVLKSQRPNATAEEILTMVNRCKRQIQWLWLYYSVIEYLQLEVLDCSPHWHWKWPAFYQELDTKVELGCQISRHLLALRCLIVLDKQRTSRSVFLEINWVVTENTYRLTLCLCANFLYYILCLCSSMK